MSRRWLHLDQTFLRRIGTIARALDSISNIEFKEIDLARGQYLYLSRITENPGITQMQLSELLCVDKTTTNRAINRLVEREIIVKQTDPINRKNQRLYSSKKGQILYETLSRESDYSTQVALQGLKPDEVEQINVLLDKVTQNVVQDWKSVKKGKVRLY
ncbi:MarR family transcriptional regulator [Weissella koreensis]|uniref:MarR family winged helix-turn-helix transcriptional regulator n=1 Tax=Weissella koreensis TaxID=165096 RepID=UPI00156D5659|nr:MarR family transcriptional regulator [Weissella koreensis]MCZ9311555.1 MarR family transcriptional regulator [Weissella koreensis]